MKKILLVTVLSLSRCFAGDLTVDEKGTYSGMLNGSVRATRAGAYNGCVSRSGILTDRYGAYAGQIVGDGTILDSKGRFSGRVLKWVDRDVE
jgi:hypothetical protein